mmetsp:Transcript_1917/g.2681  ORF Transcript_1917/g.2681 Transcript_1917/m.2681 type:complete len:160 (+) Transcript_1917:148-627(+)
MVFGNQKLNDQVFCLQEERDFFQGKYLEQVSELQFMREQLAKTKKEVVRLRQELMDRTPSEVKKPSRSAEKETEEDTASCLTDDDDEEEEDGNGADVLYEEDKELRQSAEKLLQWASYRSTAGRSSQSIRVTEEDVTEAEASSKEVDDLSSLSSGEPSE